MEHKSQSVHEAQRLKLALLRDRVLRLMEIGAKAGLRGDTKRVSQVNAALKPLLMCRAEVQRGVANL